jgi:hypothetical protein
LNARISLIILAFVHIFSGARIFSVFPRINPAAQSTNNKKSLPQQRSLTIFL